MFHVGDIVTIKGDNQEHSVSSVRLWDSGYIDISVSGTFEYVPAERATLAQPTSIPQRFQVGDHVYYTSSDSQLSGEYLRYSIGDVFITGKHKDECDHFGITDDMVPGTTDAMEIRINSVLLRYDGSIMYAYYVNTPKGTLDGIIKPSDTLKHQYTLF